MNVRVAATNNIGTSTYAYIVGVLVETVPLAPKAMYQGDATTEQQIQIEWDRITDASETGGSEILSYRIEWD